MTTMTPDEKHFAQVEAHTPIAVVAAFGHVLSHHLPCPAEMSLPHRDAPFLVMWITVADFEAWNDSGIVIDALGEIPIRHEQLGQEFVTKYADVRLPDSGVTFRLQWVEFASVVARIRSVGA